MSTPTQDAFDKFEKRRGSLSAYRAVVQTVAGPADVDPYVRATEQYCAAAARDDAWRIWLGVAERARQLGRSDVERDALQRAVDASPDAPHVLEFLADALPAGTARAHAHLRCGACAARAIEGRAESLRLAAYAFVDEGDEDHVVLSWETLADLGGDFVAEAARALTAYVQAASWPADLATRAGALLLRADHGVAEPLWQLCLGTTGLVDDAVALDWAVRVVSEQPDRTQTVLNWSRAARGASPKHSGWRALHRSWSEAVGDVDTQHVALTEEATAASGAPRAALLVKRAALEADRMSRPLQALDSLESALAASPDADVIPPLTALVDNVDACRRAAQLLCEVADARGDVQAALVGQRALSSLDDALPSQLALARRLRDASMAAEQLAVLARLVRRDAGQAAAVDALLDAAEHDGAWSEAADALLASPASRWATAARERCLHALSRAERWPSVFKSALALHLLDAVPVARLRAERIDAFAVLDADDIGDAERALWLSHLVAAFGADDADVWPRVLDLAPTQAGLHAAVPVAVAAARDAGDEARIERALSLQVGEDALQLEADLLTLAHKRGDVATADKWAEEILAIDPTHVGAQQYANERWQADPQVAQRLLLIGIDGLEGASLAERSLLLADGLRAAGLGGELPHYLAAASVADQPVEQRRHAWSTALELAAARMDAEALLTLAGVDGLTEDAVCELDETIDGLWAFGESDLAADMVDVAALATSDAQFQDRRACRAYREGRWSEAAAAWHEQALPAGTDRPAMCLAADLRASSASQHETLLESALALLATSPALPELVEALRERSDHEHVAGRFVEACQAGDQTTADHWHAAAALAHGTSHQHVAWLGWLSADPSATLAASLIAENGDAETQKAALRLRLQCATDDEQVSLRLALADLESSPETRESLLLEVLESDLGNVLARRSLAELFEQSERAEEAASLWEEVATFADTADERVEALHHAARLLLAGPEQSRALGALERVLNERPNDAEARRVLEDAYTKSNDEIGLAALWGRIAAGCTDVEEQLAWLKKAAALHEAGSEPGLAMPYLRRALGVEPANLALLERIASLQSSTGEWDALLETLERIAEATPIAEVRNEVLIRAFRVLHDPLGRHAHALDLIRAACLHLVPADSDLDLMFAAAQQGDDWAVWADAMGDVLRARPRDERRSADLRLLVDVLHERLGRTQDALLWLVEDVVAEPALDDRLDRGESLADALGSRKPLVPAYKALASTDLPAETRWRGYVGSADLAQQAGGDAIAFGILEQGLTLGKPFRDDAILRLRTLGQESTCHAEWQRVLTRLARESTTPAPLYMERARLEEHHLQDWRAAMESGLYALRNDAFDTEATALVERLAADNDAWAVLEQALTKLRDAAPTEQRADYDRWLARINGQQLGDVDAAYRLHEQAWRADTTNREARAAFVLAAEDLGRDDDAMRALTAATPTAPSDAQEWCDWVVARALAAGRVDAALAQLRQTDQLLGEAADAWVPTTQKYWNTQVSHDGAYAWFAARAHDAHTDAARVAMLQAAARFAPSDTLRADALHAIAEIAPDDGATRDALWLALDAAGRHEELCESLRLAAIAEPDDSAASALATRAAHHLVRSEHDVAHRAAVLASLVQRVPTHHDLRDDYELTLREAEAWPALVESLAERAAMSESPDAAEPHWLRAADLLDGIVEDPQQAAALLRRAKDAGHVTPEILRRRAGLCEATSDWEGVVSDVEALAALLDAEAAAHALARAAETASTRLSDPVRAQELWTRVLEQAPEWPRPHLQLARLSVAAAAFDEANAHLDAAEAHADRFEPADVAEAVALLQQRAGRASEPDDAERWLRRAHELSPSDAGVLASLLATLRDRGDLDGVATVLLAAAEQADDDRGGALFVAGAVVCMHDLADPIRAAQALSAARKLAPDSRGIAAVEGDLHFAAERWEDAAEAYHVALGFEESLSDDTPDPRTFVAGETPSTPVALYLTRYALALEQLGRTREAYDALQSAALEDEGHPLALAALARIAHARDEKDVYERFRSELASARDRDPDVVATLIHQLPAFD